MASCQAGCTTAVCVSYRGRQYDRPFVDLRPLHAPRSCGYSTKVLLKTTYVVDLRRPLPSAFCSPVVFEALRGRGEMCGLVCQSAWHLPPERNRLQSQGRKSYSSLVQRVRASPIETGSLIEKADAEVIPLKDSGSNAEEKEAEVQKRIDEAWSTGKLDLSGLRLAHLPSEVFELTRLSELSLAGNELTELDPAVGRLTSLSKLGLAGNRLRALPAEIGALKFLKGLWVHGNVLETLPTEIGQLRYLGILALGGNRLTTLPEDIGHLSSLRSLSVPGNRLENVDALVCGPPQRELCALGLFGNRLREIPQGVLGRLPGLTELWLQGNDLDRLPDSPSDWGALNNLKQLSVADNQLTSLPDALTLLPSLKDLWVYRNRLATIPQSLVATPKLAHLWLEGNPFESDALGQALLKLHRPSGKWARKIVVGIDTWQAEGLSEEVWGLREVQESVQVSTLVGRRETDRERTGYFKLKKGRSNGFWEEKRAVNVNGNRGGPEGREVKGGREKDSESRQAEVKNANGGDKVTAESGDALIFSYLNLTAGKEWSGPLPEKETAEGPASERSERDSTGLQASRSEDGKRHPHLFNAPGDLGGTATSQIESRADDDGASDRSGSGDLEPRKGLVVVAFGSAPGIPNWAGVLKRVEASLRPDKKRSSEHGLPESATFDVLYVVDAKRSWYTQGGRSRVETAAVGRGTSQECSLRFDEESQNSESEGAAVSRSDDLHLEGDFRIGVNGHLSESGSDSPLEKVRSKVASRSTLLYAVDVGIEGVASRENAQSNNRSVDPQSSGPADGSADSGKEQKRSAAGGFDTGDGIGRGVHTHSEDQRQGGSSAKDQRLSSYYRGELEAAVRTYERVLLLGDSMGASASLLFSTMATRVLSFCPQVDLSTASIRCAEDDAWFRDFREEILREVASSSAVFTVHCGCWLHDLEQAALLPAGKVTVVEHPVEDHRLAKELDYEGKLLPILRTAIEEEMQLLTSENGH